MEYFSFISVSVLALVTKWIIYAILPILTIGVFYLFELEDFFGKVFSNVTHAIKMTGRHAKGKNTWGYSDKIYWSDYFPFKLPIALMFVGFMVVASMAFIGVYHNSDIERGLTARVNMSYEEWLAKKEISNPTRTDIRVDIHRVRLDGWNPPKHFYVDFFDITTGKHYERVYVSKHCNKANELVRGDEYNIQVQVYTLSSRPGEEFREFKNLYGTFC